MKNEKSIPWACASLCYEEKKFIDYIPYIIPKAKFHAKLANDGHHYFGVILDDKTGTAHLFNRGTDAFTPLGELKAWLININIVTGADGVHNGFQRIGDEVFNFTKRYLEDYDYIKIYAHSQGSGTTPYQACLCIENLTLKHVHFDTFAAPPTGNEIFKRRIDGHMASGKLSGNRYVNPNDPIAMKELRDPNSLLLNGVDSGNEILLPNTLRWTDRKILSVLAHSPQLYTTGMWAMELQRDDPNLDYLMDLEWIRQRLVN